MSFDSRCIGDRLDATPGRFVGRSAELALFRSALSADVPPFVVLHVHGPGGIGKTALLREYERLASAAGRRVCRLDARNAEASPPAFLAALRHALGGAGKDPFESAREWPANGVLLLDTFERLSALDGWLRETFLPSLPQSSLIVIAGRNPPAPDWRADAGWRPLSRAVTLRPLAVDESRSYLSARGTPAAQITLVQGLAHGHPLALAMIADLVEIGAFTERFSLVLQPDVVRSMLARLLDHVPGAVHSQALCITTIARTTTEALLTDALGRKAGPECFDWLRGLSFIEHGVHGIFPHDTVRELLDADWQWRDAQGHAECRDLVTTHLRNRFAQAVGEELPRLRQEILFACRHDPALEPYFAWEDIGQAYAEPPAGEEDERAILEMVKRHQGEASTDIARFWLARQPQAFRVFRTMSGDVCGFMASLELDVFHAGDIAADPALAVARAFVDAHGPLEAGDAVIYLRFWMDRDAHQVPSSAVNLTAANSVTRWLTHPRLAWNFIAIANPEFWEPHFEGIAMQRRTDADFEVDGRRYAVFAHDWRVEPATTWERRRRSGSTSAGETRRSGAPRHALSRQEFAAALRDALKNCTRQTLLAGNPLLTTFSRSGAGAEREAAAALKAWLEEAARSLDANPKDRKLYRAVWHTYFEPHATQELAAEKLKLPFSTYRYHLGKGTERIVAALWHDYASRLTET